jgi:hypothetical protein
MTKQQLREAIRRIIKQELNETVTGTEAEEIAKQAGSYEAAVEKLRSLGASFQYSNAVATEIYGEKDIKNENAPAPTKPVVDPGTKTPKPNRQSPGADPSKIPTKEPGTRGTPAKAGTKVTMKEAEMLKQVIKRFKSKK